MKRSRRSRADFLRAGQIVAGKYRLEALLGMGGMASVWSATHVFTERQFAIKFLLPAIGQTEEVRRRFLLEAKASARIDHPNIIEIIDVGQTDAGDPFLVMELLTGISLESVLLGEGRGGREGPPGRMRLFDFCSLMLEVARAMAAAHARGIIHRDLKPTNIFLSQDRQGLIVPKVLDFGVSKFLTDDRGGSLTITGTILGSPMYMSPEQAQGARDIDGRTDIFAFGAILFESLVGYRCFDHGAFGALLVTVATTPPRSIDACAPHLPEPLRALVRGCLVMDRTRRIRSFDEIAARLEHLLPLLERSPETIAQVQHAPVPEEPRPRLSGPRRRVAKRRARYQTALLGVAFAILLFSAAYTSRRPVAVNRAAHAEIAPAAAQWSAPVPVVSSAPAEPSASTSTSAEAPAIDVDSLPQAERIGSSRTARRERRSAGRLHVSSASRSCTIYVDGTAVGSGEVDLDAAPGAHRLRCNAGEGEPAAPDVNVNVAEGSTTRYAFP